MIGKHFGLLRMLTLQPTKIKKHFVTEKIMKFISVWLGKGISIKNHQPFSCIFGEVFILFWLHCWRLQNSKKFTKNAKICFHEFFENTLSLGKEIIKMLSEFVDHLVDIYLHHLGKSKKRFTEIFSEKNIGVF